MRRSGDLMSLEMSSHIWSRLRNAATVGGHEVLREADRNSLIPSRKLASRHLGELLYVSPVDRRHRRYGDVAARVLDIRIRAIGNAQRFLARIEIDVPRPRQVLWGFEPAHIKRQRSVSRRAPYTRHRSAHVSLVPSVSSGSTLANACVVLGATSSKNTPPTLIARTDGRLCPMLLDVSAPCRRRQAGPEQLRRGAATSANASPAGRTQRV